MRACPNCGYANDDNADACRHCGSWLGGSPAPLPLPSADRQYLLGLGLGVIPVFVFLLIYGIAFGTSPGYSALGTAAIGLVLGVLLYLTAIIAMIVNLSLSRRRFVGYGLLTAVLATPIITVVGCNVIPAVTHR